MCVFGKKSYNIFNLLRKRKIPKANTLYTMYTYTYANNHLTHETIEEYVHPNICFEQRNQPES